MEPDDKLYQAYLEELHSLEAFRAVYDQENPRTMLERQDPDFRRLVEVLALFGARTRMAALRNADLVRRRLYQQFFPYFLSPLPSMAMVSVTPAGHMSETQSFPAGTELAVMLEQGRTVLYQTTRALRIMPIKLLAVKQVLLEGAGSRLLLTFTASYPLNENIGTLSLHINYLNDFMLSLKLWHFMEVNLSRASVQFGEYSSENVGAPCGYEWGRATPDSGGAEAFMHPLLAERLYFHFPQQALYLDLTLPESPPNWSRFTLALDFIEAWPRQFQVNKALFQLFVTPAANSLRAFSMPVPCDGLQERYLVQHPQPDMGFSLQEVLGVYQLTDAGMIPLRPGILGGGEASYEIEQGASCKDGGSSCWLLPYYPASFQSPVTLVVEANWLQGWFAPQLQQRNKLQPYRRQTSGLNWAFLDTPVPYAENAQFDVTQNSGYLNLLTLMHKPAMNRQDLLDLLASMDSVTRSSFQSLLFGLAELRMDEQLLTRAEQKSVRQVYHLRFNNALQESDFLMAAFARHVERILEAWISGVLIAVQAELLDEKGA